MGYIDIPVETEPVDVAEDAFGYVESRIPGWLPAEGNLESILIAALSQAAGELRALAALVPESIFQYFGESILGLPRYPAVQATGLTTWTAIDAAGYRVTAGTLIGIAPPATSDAYAFQVVTDFTIPPGSQTAAAVEVRALEAGADASGITGTVEMLDPLDFIEQVVLDGPTTGGQDAETIEHYLDRLSNLLTLLAPRPILPVDFAVFAQRNPAVGRAVAIDLYNPQTGDTTCPRCVTVAVVDQDGNPLPAQAKADVDAELQAQREVNFLAFVVDPSYTTIDVTAQVAVYPGYVPNEVADRVKADLAQFLSPANWGLPPFGDTGATSWLNVTEVRHNELIARIDRVDGVDYVVSVTAGVAGGAQSTADIVLTGPAPLPKPGAIVVTGVAGT